MQTRKQNTLDRRQRTEALYAADRRRQEIYNKATEESKSQYSDGLIDLKEYNQQLDLAWKRSFLKCGRNK